MKKTLKTWTTEIKTSEGNVVKMEWLGEQKKNGHFTIGYKNCRGWLIVASGMSFDLQGFLDACAKRGLK